MGFYFEDHLSMHAQAGLQTEKTLDAIVRRYRGVNPPHSPVFRPCARAGIVRGKDYRYVADFSREFPRARAGVFVYAWARIWSERASELKFDLSVHCPTVVYLNRQFIFRSTFEAERYPEKRQHLVLSLAAGWNHVVLRFRKTDAGFGGIFGTWLGKLSYYFLMPTAERGGQEGWIFTEPLAAELATIPGRDSTESDSGAVWLPRRQWPKAQQAQGQCRRIFGLQPGAVAIAWTRGLFLAPGQGEYVLSGSARGPVEVVVGDVPVFATEKAGAFSARIRVPFGHQEVMVRTRCGSRDWGFALGFRRGREAVALASPCNLQGASTPWLFAGPLDEGKTGELAALRDLRKLVPGRDGATYWRLDAPDLWVRPYNDNALYGRWNYPLGVTLYGLLHSAKLLGSEETQRYLVEHMRFCADIFDYALWDRQQYGGATNVHHLLTSIDSLDDCGSFGSSLLEVMKYFDIPGGRAIADYVADFIANKQVRLPDGTFFRKHLMHVFHEDTLWADDLYMSVPFLCRYFELTGDTRHIDDAARQFLGFRKMLFIPGKKLMSHVHDLRRGLATGIPWGRGNGWVLFSLSELLAVLPQDHALRGEVLAMFRELCTGVLAQQDAAGMWHQVLDEHDAYPETSCTAMFAYAFSRGVQHGWLDQPDAYVRAVFKAWEALNRTSIDRLGNVHGVCRGSEFSFTSDYYKQDLLWNLNDTHGIGIVLLAGVEVHRLTQFLQPRDTAAEQPTGAPRPRRRARR